MADRRPRIALKYVVLARVRRGLDGDDPQPLLLLPQSVGEDIPLFGDFIPRGWFQFGLDNWKRLDRNLIALVVLA